jgi:hypothetical protein
MIRALHIQAMSLAMPDGVHSNRVPFEGVLVRLGVESTNAPHGTNGKKIILTHAAARNSVGSLLGMGADVKQPGFDGHSTYKVGIISAAHVAGDAIHVRRAPLGPRLCRRGSSYPEEQGRAGDVV